MALYFSGSGGNYAEITNGYGSTLSNTSGTFSLWLKPIYDGGVAVATKGSVLGALLAEPDVASGAFYFGANGTTKISNAAFISDTWVHVVFGGQGTTNLLIALGYINGELACQLPGNAKWATSAANLYLGRWDTAGSFPYKGWIGDIRVWNRRLTPAEVVAVYRNQDVTSGLVERWPLTESSGSTITGTIAGLNGTITGTPTWGGTSIPYGSAPSSGRPQHPMYQQVIG